MTDILHRVGIKSSQDQVYKVLAMREGVAAWCLKSLVETGKGAPNPYDIKIDNWN